MSGAAGDRDAQPGTHTKEDDPMPYSDMNSDDCSRHRASLTMTQT